MFLFLTAACTQPVEPTCPIEGDWALQVTGWIDPGWTAEIWSTPDGCEGDTQTAIGGEVVVTDLSLSGARWTGTGTYTPGSAHDPQELVITKLDGGWQIEGRLVSVASRWLLLD